MNINPDNTTIAPEATELFKAALNELIATTIIKGEKERKDCCKRMLCTSESLPSAINVCRETQDIGGVVWNRTIAAKTQWGLITHPQRGQTWLNYRNR